MDLRVETLRVTVVLVAASLALLAPGVAGVGASLPLAVALVVVAALLSAGARGVDEGQTVLGQDLGPYLTVLWAGALVAAVAVVVVPGASPGELQAMGGVIGLLGMVNYFLRPVYGLAYRLLARA